MSPDQIELLLPASRGWDAVVRLVLGGIADRLDLGLEDLDDLQLAVEQLLVEAGDADRVRVAVEIHSNGVRTRVGPLRQREIAAALQGPRPRPGQLSLRSILETVVDSFGIEAGPDGEVVVRLEKRVAH